LFKQWILINNLDLPGPAKSPKGRRQAAANRSSSSDSEQPSDKRPRVETPPELGTEANPVRIDSTSSGESVVCLDPPQQGTASPLAIQKSSDLDDSDIGVPEPLDPTQNKWSESSEEEGWISFRPTVKQAQKQMDYVQEPRSSDED
jgi:hypothetical protein